MFPSIVATMDHGFAFEDVVGFEKILTTKFPDFLIEYDGPEENFSERANRLSEGDYLHFVLQEDMKIFCDIGKVSMSLDFFSENHQWGGDDFCMNRIYELKEKMLSLFAGDRVIFSPSGKFYPACWVHELSNEDLSVGEIFNRIGMENIIINPPRSIDISDFRDKVFCFERDGSIPDLAQPVGRNS